ncbi:MAG TPA: ABC transporter ATP-binding protein [Noviherbaspirillum sp.]|jgi:ABC-type multidrug transport system fused ATPase/permease subunit|uniref:ABC transporter ATP-binding protein n=1 Tax=Noviherbaspirillum sp. TaxID=1926288 RepID=UPI002DDCC159|nr:ABC transporter ATP-binding protein [Noviherbaspirillum sp.]HEV2611788.1 ABC transporter ATP-binding protein [Noviherbaspirillum sp.]
MHFKFMPSASSKRARELDPIGHQNTLTRQPRGLYVNMWRHAAGARLKLALTWLMLVGAALMELVSPWLGAQALNALQKDGTEAMATAAWYGVGIVAAAIVAWSLHGPGRVSERRIALVVRKNFTSALYGKLMRLPLAWHDRHHSGEVQQRISQASLALHSFTQNQFHYIKAVVHFIGAAVAIMFFSPMLGLIALIGYSVVGMIMVRFDVSLMRLAKEENAAERKFQSRLLDFLGNISTVMSFRMQDSSGRLVDDRLGKVFLPARKSITLVEVKWCIADLFSVALTWGLVAAAVWMSKRDGVILIGGIFLVHQYAQQARSVVLALADKFQTVARARTDLASAEAIWEAHDRPASGPAVPDDWRRIDISDLYYDHVAGIGTRTGQAVTGLKKVAVTLERGDRIALVGPSGAGKSTLMRVLAGQYDPHERHINVDGTPYPATRHLGSIAMLIPQEADVFEASIRENLSLSGEHSDADIHSAAHLTAFDAVMNDMSLDLDTPLSERGCNLSGGQRQRLCLARGLLAARGSSLIFMDEPTSALDPITEETVFARITAALPSACLVASVHRMNLLHHFNKVVLMANGQVQDVGTVDELLQRQPAFQEMLRHGQDHGAAATSSVKLPVMTL